MAIQVRCFNDEDMPILIKLLNDNRRNDYEFTPYTEERIRSWVQEGTLEILVAEDQGELIGTVAYNDGYWGEEIEWLIVTENPSEHTIENVLVEEIEKHVKRGKVFTVVDEGSPKIGEWAGRGYNLEGGLYHMVAILDGEKPVSRVPEDIILRSLRPDEENALVEAVNAGFGWERLKAGIIQEWKRECPPFDEEWVHVAEHANRIVSVVASRPDMGYNEHFGGRRGYLGPAATLLKYRGKNLASALTSKAMNFLFEKGMDSVALYTSEENIASLSLLRKLDFGTGHHWRFMRKVVGVN
jgi:ribosomal protein S18 acetylase RimI-like enzyme